MSKQYSKNAPHRKLVTEQEPLINYNYEFEMEAVSRKSKMENSSRKRQSSGNDIIPLDTDIRTYKARWWILFVYCMTGLSKGLLWNTWAPISGSVIIAFDWTNSIVAQIPNIALVSCTVFALPIMYVVMLKGLRFALFLAISCLVAGCLTIIVATHSSQYWLIFVSSACTGISGSVMMTCGSLVSVTWFPATERTTASSLMIMSSMYGIGSAFLINPHLTSIDVTAKEVLNKNNLTEDVKIQIRNGINNTAYIDTAVVALVFIMAVVYYPPKPVKPPSEVQTKDRVKFWSGLKLLFRNPQFWLINLAYNLITGTGLSWLFLASINFRPLGVGQVNAGWIAFTGVMAATVGSVIFSRIADFHQRKTKLIAKIVTTFSLVSIFALACIQERFIILSPELTLVLVFVLSTIASVCTLGLTPLYYEMGCETSYPVNEGLVGAVLAIGNMKIGAIYYLLMLFPPLAEDTNWMTWTMLGCTIGSVLLLFFIKEHYPRLDLEDTPEHTDTSDGESSD